MANYSITMRSIRILAFFLIAQFIIVVMQTPINFLDSNLWMSTLLFVLTSVMISRRPGTANLYVIASIAFTYALYTDEGIALGAIALLAMSIIIHRLRHIYIQDAFFVEWLYNLGIFALCLIVRNLFLKIFFTYHYSFSELLYLIVYFAIIYPVFNIIVQFIFRARREAEAGQI